MAFSGSMGRRSKGAFDLIEIALFLTAIIILFLGIIAVSQYETMQSKSKALDAEINLTVQAVSNLMVGQTSYSGISTLEVANSGYIPNGDVDIPAPNATKIINVFGGIITVSPSTGTVGTSAGTGGYSIQETNIPYAICVSELTTQKPAIEQGAQVATIGGQNIVLSTSTEAQILTFAQANCSATSPNTINIGAYPQ